MSEETSIQDLVNAGELDQALVLAKCSAINHLQSAALISTRLNAEEAVRLAKICVEIEPSFAKSHANLAYFLGFKGDLEGAAESIDKAVTIEPMTKEYHCSKGVILSGLRRIDEAIESYNTCIGLDPEFYSAIFNLGCLLYLKGDFKAGMELMEARFKNDGDLTKFRRRFHKPEWDGQADISGKKLLVYNEQGIGDAIQYSRYLSLLKDVTLIGEMQEEVVPLLSHYFDAVLGRSSEYQFVDDNPDFPPHDYVISFSSLPYRLDPHLTNIPPTPYIFPEGDLALPKDKLKIGLIWAGSPWHSNDMNRSCRIKDLLKLADVQKIQLYSFQKGSLQRTWGNLEEGIESFNLIDLSKHLIDFNHTAILLNQMDLLISVDTAAVHLMGAMDKPVWMLTAFCADHRWLLNKADTPWYPSMRIFRQETIGDWSGVVEQVCEELETLTCQLHV